MTNFLFMYKSHSCQYLLHIVFDIFNRDSSPIFGILKVRFGNFFQLGSSLFLSLKWLLPNFFYRTQTLNFKLFFHLRFWSSKYQAFSQHFYNLSILKELQILWTHILQLSEFFSLPLSGLNPCRRPQTHILLRKIINYKFEIFYLLN